MSKKTNKTVIVRLKRARKLRLGDVIVVLDSPYRVTRLVHPDLRGTNVSVTAIDPNVTPQMDWTLRKENEIILVVNKDRRIPVRK